MTLVDIIVLSVIALLIVLAIRLNHRQKKEGKSCCSRCGSCAHRCDKKEDGTCGR